MFLQVYENAAGFRRPETVNVAEANERLLFESKKEGWHILIIRAL